MYALIIFPNVKCCVCEFVLKHITLTSHVEQGIKASYYENVEKLP